MSAPVELRCWRCGTVIDAELVPLRREEVCVACNADLHVCKLCRFYNPSVSDACDEPIAQDVSNKERANFCDYFKPSPRAWKGQGDATSAARAALDALFGAGPAAGTADGGPTDDNRAELDRLFGLDRK